MTMIVASLTELKGWFYGDGVNGGSCFYASLVWAVCTAVLGVVQWQFFKSQYNFTFLKMVYFRHLFKGLRMKWQSRAYPFIYFARIYIFTTLAVVRWNGSKDKLLHFFGSNLLVIFLILQFAYFIGIWASFPFSHYKYNVTLIMNEFVFVVWMIFTVKSKSKNGLSSGMENMMLNLILYTFVCSVVISFGKDFWSYLTL